MLDPLDQSRRYENPDITAKYESWEKFFEIMFVISCRSKHSTDVEGEAKAIWESAPAL